MGEKLDGLIGQMVGFSGPGRGGRHIRWVHERHIRVILFMVVLGLLVVKYSIQYLTLCTADSIDEGDLGEQKRRGWSVSCVAASLFVHVAMFFNRCLLFKMGY